VFNPYQAVGVRTSYANNVIPQADLQVVDQNFAGGLTTAEKILAGLPAPNAPGDHNGTLNNYSASGSGAFNDYQYVVRGDYTSARSSRSSAATLTPTSSCLASLCLAPSAVPGWATSVWPVNR